jgi:uncharacterized RDD family membrane protein YckC
MGRKAYDTTYSVETPEGIDLEVQLAGPIPRILAYVYDVLVRGGILLVVSIVLLFLDRMGAGIFLVVSFLMEWFYPVYFEVFKQGQTPGKRKLGLVVVHEDLTPIAWGASMTRNLLRTADFLPFAYLFGLIAMCVGKRFQRLGDIAAGSLVIHQAPVSDTESLPACQPVAPPVPLDLEDQVAIINFVRRHNRLTKARQQELAEILDHITHEGPDNAVSRLQGIGIWLLGAR